MSFRYQFDNCAICFEFFFINESFSFLFTSQLSIEYVTIQVPSGGYPIYEDDDQKNDDEILYDENNASELTFVTSPWSTKCLVYDEFLYNCHSSHGNKVYWRCHNYSR